MRVDRSIIPAGQLSLIASPLSLSIFPFNVGDHRLHDAVVMTGRQSVAVMNHRVILFLLALLLASAHSINHFLDSFETLNYRPLSTSRTKRSIDGSLRPIELRFRSHNRTFHIQLEPIEEGFDVFAEDFYVDEDGRDVNQFVKPHRFLYNGHVRGDPHSTVYGSILDGIFDGHVHLGDGTSYTIDKVSRYFDMDKRPKNYHSVMYPDDAINHAKVRMKRSAEEGGNSTSFDDEHGCGLNSRIRREMEKLQNSGENNLYASMTAGAEPPQYSYRDQYFEDFTSRYTNSNRSKRSLSIPVDMIEKRPIHRVRTCSIYMQADQKLYEHILHKEGNGNPVRTREEIVSLFYNHIKAVNLIYESTDFRGIRGLNFVIQRTSIFTPDTCFRGRPVNDSGNPFCEENVDVSNYLNMNSQRNHSAFCLAYALTFRDFVGGTLGLAWVASPNHNTAGGICQVHQRYNEGSRGWVLRSLNTGIVTLVNYGNRVPTRVSQLTLAHEIGHNFGSPHDFPQECQPGLPDGNFIMFASATSGDKPNNARFSKCSIQNISMVLAEVLHNIPVDPQKLYSNIIGKRNCFQERTSAFCGNQIKEPGEECDCGFSDKDCEQMADSCCIPHEINGQYRMSRNACRRRPNAQCSPSEGQCCNASKCSFFSYEENKQCREESECLEEQYCNGISPICPDSRSKPDGLACQDATKVCHAGACNGSVCAFVGLKDCFLTEGRPEQLCHLACEKDGKCVSSFMLPEFDKNPHFIQEGRAGQSGLLLHPGSPCNNYKGYCDIFRKCRSVDSNGPLARLKNLLFNKHTIKTVSQWVQEHWWAVILMGICLLVLMALFVKCCAVHTPSTNPNKMPALNFYDTLRHPQTLMHRRRHTRAAAGAANQSAQGASANAPNRPSNGGGAAARHHRNRRTSANRPSASAAATRQAARSEPSAPPLIPAASIPAPPAGPVPPVPLPPPPVAVPLPPPPPAGTPSVIVVEPPPPYTAHADPASQLGGPKRGHRKNRRRPADSDNPKPSNNRRGAK
uniref:ADAM10 endopeptidase n=1 Tax=Steinernema glaseri TaxID=37863 RepID=A0A1I8A7R9_9BILA